VHGGFLLRERDGDGKRIDRGSYGTRKIVIKNRNTE